jgi:hypothetical protein
MECARCFFSRDGRTDEKKCRVCGRSYRPSVNVYLAFITLTYLVFVAEFRYCLTGFRFAIKARPSLAVFHWLRYPVDILEHPALILVMGGLMALLVLAPVMVSMLHGKRGGILLAVIALMLGPSWLLALLLVASIWIAGDYRLRLSSRTLSAILACVPVWLFYLIGSAASEDVVLPGAYYLPALAAIVIDIVLIALIVAVLRRLSWNARVAGVLLFILCVIPIAAHKIAVGDDEIRYGVFSRTFGLASNYFADIPHSAVRADIEAEIKREADADAAAAGGNPAKTATTETTGHPLQVPGLAPAAVDRKAREMRLRVAYETTILVENLRRQKEAVGQACRRYLDEHPNTRHRADILYVLARSLDMALDTRGLRDENQELDGGNLTVHFDASRIVGQESLALWQMLRDQYPESPYAAEASVKIADCLVRQGHLDQGMAAYDTVLKAFAAVVDEPSVDTKDLSVFTDVLKAGSLLRRRAWQERVEQQYAAAQRAMAFLQENRRPDGSHDAVLKEYLSLPPFLPAGRRREELAALLERAGQSPLADNLAYEIAMAEPVAFTRRKMLTDVKDKYARADGAAMALVALAELEASNESNRIESLRRAIGYCDELIRDYHTSYLSRVAEQKRRQYERLLETLGRGGSS